MTLLRPLLTALCATILFIAPPAHADTTAEDAAAVQAQLHDWLTNLVAPMLPADAQPVTVSPDGDGFLLRVNSPASANAVIPQGSAVTLKATRLEGGRWALDGLTLPSPLIITIPARSIAHAHHPDSPDNQPNTITINTEKATYQGIFDPSFTTASHFESHSEGTSSSSPASESEAGSTTSSMDMEPLGEGRMLLRTHTSTNALHQRFMQANGTPGELAWSHSETKAKAESFSPGTLADLIRALSPLLADHSGARLSPEQHDVWNRAVADLFSISGPISSESDISDITLRVVGGVISAGSVHVGTRFETRKAAPYLTLHLALHDLQIPTLPRGGTADLLPHDLTFGLHLGGIPDADIRQFLLSLSDDVGAADAAGRQQQQLALLGQNGFDVGIDTLAFSLDTTAISGHALAHISGQQQMAMSGDFAAEHLDALLTRASQDPRLMQSLPILTIARGLGKQDGTTTRWHIEAKNNAILVNGFDIRAFVPRSAAQRPQPAAPASPIAPAPTPKPPARP